VLPQSCLLVSVDVMCQPIRGYGLVGHSSRPVIVVAATIAHLGFGVHNLYIRRG
jgi:hypothetical protein